LNIAVIPKADTLDTQFFNKINVLNGIVENTIGSSSSNFLSSNKVKGFSSSISSFISSIFYLLSIPLFDIT